VQQDLAIEGETAPKSQRQGKNDREATAQEPARARSPGRRAHRRSDRLAALAEDGQIQPAVERTYPLEQAAAALTEIESGHTRGKLVLTIRA